MRRICRCNSRLSQKTTATSFLQKKWQLEQDFLALWEAWPSELGYCFSLGQFLWCRGLHWGPATVRVGFSRKKWAQTRTVPRSGWKLLLDPEFLEPRPTKILLGHPKADLPDEIFGTPRRRRSLCRCLGRGPTVRAEGRWREHGEWFRRW